MAGLLSESLGGLTRRHSQRDNALLLVPGCASNALSFDLAPRASLARYLAAEGYDTWVVEMRGIGLSTFTAPPPLPRWLGQVSDTCRAANALANVRRPSRGHGDGPSRTGPPAICAPKLVADVEGAKRCNPRLAHSYAPSTKAQQPDPPAPSGEPDRRSRGAAGDTLSLRRRNRTPAPPSPQNPYGVAPPRQTD